jgi:REP element-mobilizing transposase RayT
MIVAEPEIAVVSYQKRLTDLMLSIKSARILFREHLDRPHETLSPECAGLSIDIVKYRSMFKQFHQLRKKPYWGNHFWAKGYCVDKVGLNAEMIQAYVKYQEKKERLEEQLTIGK